MRATICVLPPHAGDTGSGSPLWNRRYRQGEARRSLFEQSAAAICRLTFQAAPAAVAALDSKIETFENGYIALENADALVIFTDWQKFRNPDFELIAENLKKAVIFDGRNLYDPKVVEHAGFE